MAEVVLSTGVHANEVDARRYAQEIAEKLRSKGHTVTLVKRPESSTRQVLHFNRMRIVLDILFTHYEVKAGRGHLESKKFEESITPKEKEFLDQVLQSRTVNWILSGHDYEESRQRLNEKGLNLLSNLTPIFKKRAPDIFQKAVNAGIESPPTSLAQQYEERRGSEQYRVSLSKKYPHAFIIDLHNYDVNTFERVEREQPPLFKPMLKISLHPSNLPYGFKRMGRVLVGKGKEGIQTEQPIYHEGKGRPVFFTIELPAVLRSVKLNTPYGNLFYKSHGVLRSGTTPFEQMYGAVHFPPAEQKMLAPQEIERLVNWLHRQIIQKKIRLPRNPNPFQIRKPRRPRRH
ncbi:MAG: hypothetical protein HY393_00135 [Candidatus Diapherotrites archaeon]|nr:hypothetical protein [Candidatus Diapherotrites archaeon]